MTDRPIIFSAPMIRALLEGRKTQTRRVVKAQPGNAARGCYHRPDGRWIWVSAPRPDNGVGLEGVGISNPFRLPYAPGDRLWVREAWRSASAYDDLSPSAMGGEEPIRYEADEAWQTWGWGVPLRTVGRFRSSMHMPRWASRLTLTVTDVRVQRLQDIRTMDAIAEGIDLPWVPGGTLAIMAQGIATDGFRALWNSIHGPEAWAANPWVAAISFTVRQGNIDQ